MNAPNLQKKVSVRVQPENSNYETIHVICRFRPIPNQVKKVENGRQNSNLNVLTEVYKIDESQGTVEVQVDNMEKKSFAFDKIFGYASTQANIFHEVEEIIDSIVVGFNGTILAYGQTSSGKTHTMEGPSLRDKIEQGVIPRTIEKLFTEIGQSDLSTSFTVSVSYYEIYCEKLRDLLNPLQDSMKIREKDVGFVIPDITEIYCTDAVGVMRVVEIGKVNRATAPTLMNADSSRSHSILSVMVIQKNQATGRHKKGKLTLVDLAGSEKVSKTGATGARLEEAKNINKSLSALGMVINALCDGSSHIPYRDSKLTRVLSESLGGNSKTALIICCAPEARQLQETLSTLRFGERAKKIKNNVKLNEELSAVELKALLVAARLEIDSLKAILTTSSAAVATPLVDRSASKEDVGTDTLSHTPPSNIPRQSGSLSPTIPTPTAPKDRPGNERRKMKIIMTSAKSKLEEPDGQEIEANNQIGDNGAPISTTTTATTSSDQITKLLKAKEEAEAETRGLRARISELTEEVEFERATRSSEVVAWMSLSSEVQKLRTTINEMEIQLQQAKAAGFIPTIPSVSTNSPSQNNNSNRQALPLASPVGRVPPSSVREGVVQSPYRESQEEDAGVALSATPRRPSSSSSSSALSHPKSGQRAGLLTALQEPVKEPDLLNNYVTEWHQHRKGSSQLPAHGTGSRSMATGNDPGDADAEVRSTDSLSRDNDSSNNDSDDEDEEEQSQQRPSRQNSIGTMLRTRRTGSHLSDDDSSLELYEMRSATFVPPSFVSSSDPWLISDLMNSLGLGLRGGAGSRLKQRDSRRGSSCIANGNGSGNSHAHGLSSVSASRQGSAVSDNESDRCDSVASGCRSLPSTSLQQFRSSLSLPSDLPSNNKRTSIHPDTLVTDSFLVYTPRDSLDDFQFANVLVDSLSTDVSVRLPVVAATRSSRGGVSSADSTSGNDKTRKQKAINLLLPV